MVQGTALTSAVWSADGSLSVETVPDPQVEERFRSPDLWISPVADRPAVKYQPATALAEHERAGDGPSRPGSVAQKGRVSAAWATRAGASSQ